MPHGNQQFRLHDTVELEVIAGNGGNGVVSFRREAHVPKGGPDGGDGGKGGDVVIIGDNQVNTLFDLYRLKIIRAKNGHDGMGKRMTGKSQENLVVRVPLGCEIEQITSDGATLLADITKNGQQFVAAKGGKGGLGNWHYRSATNQVPRFAKPGELGEQKKIIINLKLLADVGLVGLPNVGKSTLLSRISDAKPKIADYAFTTLTPNIGVVNHKGKTFVVADIPGLIKGASEGRGLGYQFLKHIERTKLIVHILDAGSKDLKKDYQSIRTELANFSQTIIKKPEIVSINKTDAFPDADFSGSIKISAFTGKNISELLDAIIKILP